MKILTDLRGVLDDTVKRIAAEDENPERWDTPVLHIMESLEYEAEGYEDGEQAYANMVQKVRDALSDWLEDRTWGY
ncbi:MAG: hypothetical protein ACK2UW_19310 [Anaerolineales bacterium]|jgi:hypothetical protein